MCGVEGLISNRHVLRCVTISWRGFREFPNRMYLQKTEDATLRAHMESVAADSWSNLGAFLGKIRSSPFVILCSDLETCARFSGSANSRILTHRTPYNDFIVVGPDRMESLLLTHELVHAELDARLGLWKTLIKVPMWFQEGLAMVISGDQRFDEVTLRAAIEKTGINPELKDLESWRSFNRLAAKNSQLAYGLAFKEVSLWYRKAGKEGVRKLLDCLEKGEAFSDAYRRIEREGGGGKLGRTEG